MTHKEFKRLGSVIWGPGRGWQKTFAQEIGVSSQSVSNWLNGRYAMPVLVQKYIELKQEVIELTTENEKDLL